MVANENTVRKISTIRVIALGRSGRQVKDTRRGVSFRLVAVWTTGVETPIRSSFPTLFAALDHGAKLLKVAAQERLA